MGTRRHFNASILSAAGLALAAAPAARAQAAWPTRPVRLLIPFPPGGSMESIGRLLATKMQEAWGQPVVVDNRPGGNTVIGTDALAKSAPDGYTLMLTASTHVITPLLQPVPFDANKDFTPVSTVVKSEFLLVVNPAVPAQTLQEFIAHAKANPDRVNYASSGAGNPNHLAAELFNQLTGARLKHIPYKGGGQAITDLIGGQVQALFSVPTSVIQHVKTGRLRALAYTGTQRLPTLPQVPTFTEAGLAGFNMKSWQAVLAPAGTPKAVVDKVAAEVARIMALPEVAERVAANGQDVWLLAGERFAAEMRADTESYGKVIRGANIKAE